jgi:hypothetical protein
LSEGPLDGVCGVKGSGPLKLTPALLLEPEPDLLEEPPLLPLAFPDPEVGDDFGAEPDN